mgnify:CR=1 FL=1
MIVVAHNLKTGKPQRGEIWNRWGFYNLDKKLALIIAPQCGWLFITDSISLKNIISQYIILDMHLRFQLNKNERLLI